MPDKSILDARLAEIDRRLRTIQSGLAPAAEAAAAEREARAPVISPEREVRPRVVPPDAAPVPQRLSEPSAARPDLGRPDLGRPDLAHLAELVDKLTALLERHERLLACAPDLVGRSGPARPGAALTLSAGPFAGIEALRRFERSLQTLPEVRRVVVREYEGSDRAIVDVHLSEPTT